MKYETPLVDIVFSESDDVITASDGLVLGDDSTHEDGF